MIRAVRVFPHEITSKNVKQVLKRLHNLGITDIFYQAKNIDGKVFYSSKLAEVVNDRLDFLCQSAKDYKMRASVWFCTFTEGYQGELFGRGTSRFLQENSECAAVNSEGYNTLDHPVPCDRGLENYACPANPKTREYELTLIKEIVRKYPVNGIHLDFIRYPIPGDYCYCDYCSTNFKNAFGLSIKDERASRYLSKWRQKEITNFVNRVHSELKGIDKSLRLSALVWTYNHGLHFTQDWKLWNIDFVSPMFFHKSFFKRPVWIKDEVKRNKIISKKRIVAAIGGPYSYFCTKKEWNSCERYAIEGGAEGILYEHYSLFEVLSALENGRVFNLNKLIGWNLLSIRRRFYKLRRSIR